MKDVSKKFIFESERLIFVRPEAKNLDFFKECSLNPEIMGLQGGIMSDVQIKTFLTRIIQHWEKYDFGHYLAVLKTTKKPIGYFSLKYLSDSDSTQKIPDLGFALLPEYWGKGFATEGSKALVKHAFDKHHFKKIQALNNPKNISGTKVLKKIGFKEIGSIEVVYLGRNYGKSTKWEISFDHT